MKDATVRIHTALSKPCVNRICFPDHRKSVPGGCGKNVLFLTLRKTNIDPLLVRATKLDARDWWLYKKKGPFRALRSWRYGVVAPRAVEVHREEVYRRGKGEDAAVGVAGPYRASVQCAYCSINPLYSSMAGNFANLWGAGVEAQGSFSVV